MDAKYEKLKKYLKDLKKIVIAYSGGIDSSFLLKVASEVLGDNVLAIHVKFSVYDKAEFEELDRFAKSLNVNYKVLDIDEMKIDQFSQNPADRCYFCKKYIFNKIINISKSEGYNIIVDGSNKDDLTDYRPGERAIKELNIISPLKENNFSKNDIRQLSKKIGINFWNKPSAACLASRFPYNTLITKKDLNKVNESEIYIRSKGFSQVRVRCHGNIARIELKKEELSNLFKEELLEDIQIKLNELGFKYVTLDLKGYRIGSLNEEL